MNLIEKIDALGVIQEAQAPAPSPEESRQSARSSRLAAAYRMMDRALASNPSISLDFLSSDSKYIMASDGMGDEDFNLLACGCLAIQFILAAEASLENPVFSGVGFEPNVAKLNLATDEDLVERNCRALMEHLSINPMSMPAKTSLKKLGDDLFTAMAKAEMSDDMASFFVEHVVVGGAGALAKAIADEILTSYNQKVSVTVSPRDDHGMVSRNGDRVLLIDFQISG